MLSIDEFEKKIQDEIHPNLWISKNLHTSDMAGVYMGNHYIQVSLPQRRIHRAFNPDYKARPNDRPYRTIPEAERDINRKIHHY